MLKSRSRRVALLPLAGVLSLSPHLYAFEPPRILAPEEVEKNIADYGWGSYAQTSDRVRVDCADLRTGRQLAVIVIAGQSNAGNHASRRFGSHEGVYNFNILDRECYLAKDPLLGTTGTEGNLFTRLGQLIVERGAADAVLLVPVGVASSLIEQWAPDGPLFRRIIAAVEGLRSRGLEPTMFLWQQGEGNFTKVRDKTDLEGISAQYAAELRNIVGKLRGTGSGAPFPVK